MMRIDAPFMHISIDHFRDDGALPWSRFSSGEFDWATCRDRFFDGFHRALGAFCQSGNNLILEHILDSDAFLSALTHALQGVDVFTVGVHCPADVLAKREAARGDRRLGSAQEDQLTIHKGHSYDLDVDGTRPVDHILAVWRRRKPPLAFARGFRPV